MVRNADDARNALRRPLLDNENGARRVRRAVSLLGLGNVTTTSAPTPPPREPVINSPVICATIGEVVLFTVEINNENR